MTGAPSVASAPGEGKIAAAACQTADGRVWSLPAPARHHDVLRKFRIWDKQHVQGFVTQRGVFVHRLPALHIARAAGQLIRETAPHAGLFSEDVW